MQFTIQHMEDWQNIAETVISKLEHNILLLKGNLGAGKQLLPSFSLKTWEVQMK